MISIEPRPLFSLIAQLTDLDVDLPPEVVTAAALLQDATNGELTRLALEPASCDLVHLDRSALVEHIREHAARRVVTDTMAESVWQISLSLAQQAGDLLAERADDLISQLRPTFEQAAREITSATKAGIRAGITAEQVMDLGPKAIAAWRSLPAHAATLDRIASARIALSETLGVAPSANPFGPRQYGAAFSASAPKWDTRTSGADRWLRLAAQPEPLTLLSIEESGRAARATITMRQPIAPSNADVLVTSGDAWLR